MKLGFKAALCAGTVTAALAGSPLALAQEGPEASQDRDASSSSDIVVTAQRREEAVQDVPIPINTISADQLEVGGIRSAFELLSAVPSITMTTTGNTANMFIRGVGTTGSGPNNEGSVAMYIDDVYMATPQANLVQFNYLSQVTVLKGPQGTLFGRNSTGGVIQLSTRDPSHTASLDTSLTAANYDAVSASLYGTWGITDDLAANVSILYENQNEGWGYNPTQQQDIQNVFDRASIRTRFLYTPTPSTEVRLSLDHNQQDNDGANYQPTPGNPLRATLPPGTGDYDSIANDPDRSTYENNGASLRVDQDLGFADLVSISAYRDIYSILDLDQDMGTSRVVFAHVGNYSEYLTQEVQLLSPDDAPFTWTFGVFYLQKDDAYDPLGVRGSAVAAVGGFRNLHTGQHTESLSAYGQVTYPLSENTNLTGGLRFTTEDIENVDQRVVSGLGTTTYPDQSFSAEDWTWRVALDHHFSPNVMGYVSYDRGLKSGGYNLGTANVMPYLPEVLDAYQAGLNTEWNDGRLRANASVFFYQYADIQVQSNIAGTSFINNAAAAEIMGFDFDVSAFLTDNWSISAAGTVLDGEYTSYTNAIAFSEAGVRLGGPGGLDVTGNQIVYTPDLTASLSSDYVIPSATGDITLRGELVYYGGAPLTPDGGIEQPEYMLLHSSINWDSPSGRYGLRLWGRNLTDELYWRQRQTVGGFGGYQTAAAPRTYGVTLSMHF